MDETYGTSVDDECFDNHEFDNDTDPDSDDGIDDDTDDDINDGADDDAADGARGQPKTAPGPCLGTNEHPRRHTGFCEGSRILDLVLA